MENNKTFITMTKVTLTPAQLSDIIDQAFALGKVYSADELQSAGFDKVPSVKGSGSHAMQKFLDTWGRWIEQNGGDSLNSGDAKLDILWDACAASMKESLKDVIDY